MLARALSLCFILIAGVLLAYLQHLALAEYLYFKLWWMDILMHALGGLIIGSMVAYAIRYRLPFLLSHAYVLVVLAALGVGIAWEVFEWMYRIYDARNYVADTAIDLVMDTLGAVLGALLVLWRSR